MLSYRNLCLISFSLLLIVSITLAEDNSLNPVACDFTISVANEIDCFHLAVPENRVNPESNTITLSLAILRNPSGNPDPDPILFLQGGPGGSTLGTLHLTYENRFEPLFATNRDIIIFDQRGVGNSQPALNCLGYRNTEIALMDYYNNSDFVSRPEIEVLLGEALRECGESLSNRYDLSGYNSVQSAADIEAIRLAFGYEEVNLWGISYGSRLALTAMRDYPDSFRRVVLDGVYPLEVNIHTELPANFNRSLQVLFDDCKRDRDCNRSYPDLETVLYDTVDQLNENPVRFNAPNPYTNKSYQGVYYDGDLMLHTLFRLFYATEILPRLPELIYDASEGRFAIWMILVGWLAGQSDNFAIGMNYAVQCQEEYYFTESGSIYAAWEAFPQFESYRERIEFSEQMTAICNAFNAGESPISENQAVNSELPALLLAGKYDPVTPPHWAIQVDEQLSNSLYLEFDAHGHAPSAFKGCAQSIVIDFIRLEDMSELDVSCMETIRMRFSGTHRGDFDDVDSADASVTNDG